jgi:hypothetical protein
MIYENFSFSSREEVISLIETGNSEHITKALIGAVNGIDDWLWLQEVCLKCVNHNDF